MEQMEATKTNFDTILQWWEAGKIKIKEVSQAYAKTKAAKIKNKCAQK